jgi:hypothetical protein
VARALLQICALAAREPDTKHDNQPARKQKMEKRLLMSPRARLTKARAAASVGAN